MGRVKRLRRGRGGRGALMRTRRLSHPLAANGSCDLVIVEVSFKLGGHVVFRLVLQIRLPLWGGGGQRFS